MGWGLDGQGLEDDSAEGISHLIVMTALTKLCDSSMSCCTVQMQVRPAVLSSYPGRRTDWRDSMVASGT